MPPATEIPVDSFGTPRHHRAVVGQRARAKGADAPEVDEARRDLRAAKLAKTVRALVDQAPPLTDEQRDRLALLLRRSPGGASG